MLYLVVSFVVIPFLRRYRDRYHQYLPLEALATRTTSFRHRILNGVNLLLFPGTWTGGGSRVQVDDDPDDDSEGSFESASEGERMVGVMVDGRRREALEQRRDGRDVGGESQRRLSRELEEGFRDDSSEDDDDADDEDHSIIRR